MTDDNFQNLPLNESFERVARVAEERAAFNEQMTDQTEAMNNLIAQDADLIDINNKDSAVLLPCPFCGGVQIEAFHHIDRGWGASWHVECVAEECGNSTCHHDTEATAITAWNTRQRIQSDALLDAEGVKLYWYRQGKDDGVEQERAKIVAWLREQDGHGYDAMRAECIEAGEQSK